MEETLGQTGLCGLLLCLKANPLSALEAMREAGQGNPRPYRHAGGAPGAGEMFSPAQRFFL